MASNKTPFHPPLPKAVAIEYDVLNDAAPKISARGEGHVAEQIMALAFAHGIKVRKDADLVEILSVMEVDSVIPVEAYAAIGEILTYVYKANASHKLSVGPKRNTEDGQP